MGLSSELSCEAGSFSHCLNPHLFFQSEVLRLYFPVLKSWVVRSVSLPSCCSQFICMHMWGHLHHQPPHPQHPPATALPIVLSTQPSCPSLPLLLVWMNVSSLSSWLLDPYNQVQFSASSGCFLFLKLLLSFFWFVRGGTVCLPMPPSWPEI